MGGASVPSSTSQFQQVATGIWGSPQATKLALPILKPALANIKNQQDMLMGFQKGDPAQTRKFLGLPEGASSEETLTALNRANNPVTSQVQYQPPAKTAAHGGIMSLEEESAPDPRKFATGGTAKTLTASQKRMVQNISAAIQDGTVTQAQIDRLNTIEKNTGRNVSPYTDTGSTAVADPKVLKAVNAASTAYQASPAGQEKTALQTAIQKEGLTAADAYLNQAGKFGFDPDAYDAAMKRGDLAGTTTNPLYAQAIRQLQAMEKQPEQFGQATQAYQDAIAGLKGAANYSPEQVQAQQIEAASIDRSSIRDVNAQRAEVERMQAAMMQAPTEANVRDYEAAQAQLNQMQGPKSWTDQGTAAQYMSPYMQNVVDIQKREANRDFAKQMARLDAQAVGAGAYGGSRNALERSEARRAQAQRLGDIQAQGQQQAYQSGMGQFSAEQGLGLQAGQANLSAAQQTTMANQQALNQQRQQYVNNALQAAMQSYGGQLTAEQQNQVAQNASSQFNAQSQNTANNNYVQQQLTAQLQNQGMDFNTAQQNAAMLMQSRTANQQAALQASMANQSAGLQANQQSIGALGQVGNMGQGLGALGTAVGGYNANLANMYGQAGGTLQGLGQNWYNQQTQNAGSIWGGPTALGNQGMGVLGGMGGGQQGVVSQATQQGK